jgi:hypothetical protein
MNTTVNSSRPPFGTRPVVIALGLAIEAAIR